MVSYKEFSAAAQKQGMSQSQIDTAWGKVVNSGSKSTNTSSSVSNNTTTQSVKPIQTTQSIGDVYGDKSKQGTAGQYTGEGIKTSQGLSVKPTEQQDLGSLAKFGADVYADKNFDLSKRNDIIANNLLLSGQDTAEYLNQFSSFKNASDADKQNTIRAINERLGSMKAQQTDMTDINKGLEDEVGAGKYMEGDKEVDILGYNDLSPDYQKYIDQMSDADKKYINNMWAAGMQDQVKTYLDTMRTKEQAEDIRGQQEALHNVQLEANEIQYGQQLRNAKEQVANLKQNWEYLGNMGMPGLSKVKLDAISDSITEAETQLGEMKRLQDLSRDATNKEWDIDTTQYEQQISNLMYDLNWKVNGEIQNALNKYTTAELEGQLDTIDGVTAFKRSLLEELDKNISGLTTGSLQQMQYITQTYADMADKAYEEAKLYKQNANIVNGEMSAVKGYYVDGNGNAILDKNGSPIKVPQSAPLDPVFDKESGKLITFGYDANGNIVANVQQVYAGDQSNMQSTVISLLESGCSAQEIAKYTGMDLSKVIDLSKMVNVTNRPDGLPMTYSGANYNAVSSSIMNGELDRFTKAHGVGSWGGQCGAFVNDYLEEMGVGHLYSDPVEYKKATVNSSEPTVGGIAVFDWSQSPNATDAQKKYGHVAIIKSINNDGTITVLESNHNGDQTVHESRYDMKKVYGYFDPTKSIEQYNAEGQGSVGGETTAKGYDENYTTDFDTYLTKGLNGLTKTTQDNIISQFGSLNNFVQQANNYKAEINSRVPDTAQRLLDLIDSMENMSWAEYQAASMGIKRSDGYKYKKEFDNFVASAALQNLIDLKSKGATFGALSDSELGFITNSAVDIDFGLKYSDFKNKLQEYKNKLTNKLGDGGMSTNTQPYGIGNINSYGARF